MSDDASLSDGLVRTGIPGLDQLLRGGLTPRAWVLVEGVPGAGKTTLGLQFLERGITLYGEPGVVVTFEEFAQELYRDGASYGWNLRGLEEEGMLRVMCTSPEVFAEDLLAPDGIFDRTVVELGARRVLVDSITQMGHITADPLELRRLVYSLRNALKRHGLTAVVTKELSAQEGGAVPFEEYLADTVIRLGYRMLPEIGVRVRELEVSKSRARPHLPGRHLLEMTPEGLRVVPEPALSHTAVPTPEIGFASSGSAGLDGMLGGGLVRGSTTIVAGSTGVGKTVLGLQFLCAGAEAGESGLLVSFEQSPEDLRRLAESLGLPGGHLQEGGTVHLMHERVKPGPLGFAVARVAEELERLQPRRVVLDALSTLARVPGEEQRNRADVVNLLSLMQESGATVVACDETPGIVGEFEVTGGVLVSSMADAIVIMRYVELGSEVRRAVSILKARCANHDKQIREYVIGPGGIELREKFDVTTGLLKGLPMKRGVEDFF